ncbi:hypothetical protein A9Q94_09475 [Rhodobacterales bacterium 56_14_T64]|nr:hypothetical protein A9Q94_09475 [Rhodobacterales bacterium 56_14_T64]
MDLLAERFLRGKRKQPGGSQGSRLPSTQEGKQIQASLNYFGFDEGSVDGQLGRKSKVAVSQYQAYLGYPVSGQLSPYGQDLLISSYQHAMSSGYLATQQSMAHPGGPRGLLNIYLTERRVPQPNFPQQNQPQQYSQQPTMMVNTNPGAFNGQQQNGQPQAAFANPNVNAYGAQQQYGQPVQQPSYGAVQPNVQAYGAQQQYVPQGQVVQQAVQMPFVPQGALVADLPDTGAVVTQVAVPQQPQPMAAPTNRRWALVIGADGYQSLENLIKARNDAQSISSVLSGQGFEVRTLYDPDRRDINGAVSTMANQIDPGDEVLFYFAGHGVEVEGRNFLLPSDVPVIN